MKLIQYVCTCVCLTIAATDTNVPDAATVQQNIGQIALQPTSQSSLRQVLSSLLQFNDDVSSSTQRSNPYKTEHSQAFERTLQVKNFISGLGDDDDDDFPTFLLYPEETAHDNIFNQPHSNSPKQSSSLASGLENDRTKSSNNIKKDANIDFNSEDNSAKLDATRSRSGMSRQHANALSYIRMSLLSNNDANKQQSQSVSDNTISSLQGVTPTQQVHSTFKTNTMGLNGGHSLFGSNSLLSNTFDDSNDAYKYLVPGMTSGKHSSFNNPLLKYTAAKKVYDFDDKNYRSPYAFQSRLNTPNTNTIGALGTNFPLGKSLNNDLFDDNKMRSTYFASQFLPRTGVSPLAAVQSSTSTNMNQRFGSSLALSAHLNNNDDGKLRSTLLGDDDYVKKYLELQKLINQNAAYLNNDDKLQSTYLASQLLQNTSPKATLTSPALFPQTATSNMKFGSNLALTARLNNNLFDDDNKQGKGRLAAQFLQNMVPRARATPSITALSSKLNSGLFDDDNNKLGSAYLNSKYLQSLFPKPIATPSITAQSPTSTASNQLYRSTLGLTPKFNSGLFDDDNNKLGSAYLNSKYLQSVLPKTSATPTTTTQSQALTKTNHLLGSNFGLSARLNSGLFDDDNNKLGSAYLNSKYLQSVFPKSSASTLTTAQSPTSTATNQLFRSTLGQTSRLNSGLFDDDNNNKFGSAFLMSKYLQSMSPKTSATPSIKAQSPISTNHMLGSNFGLTASLNNDDNKLQSSFLGAKNLFDDDSSKYNALQNFVSPGINRAASSIHQNSLAFSPAASSIRNLAASNAFLGNNLWDNDNNNMNAYVHSRMVNNAPVYTTFTNSGTVQQLPSGFGRFSSLPDDNDYYPTRFSLPQYTGVPTSVSYTPVRRSFNFGNLNTSPFASSLTTNDDNDGFFRRAYGVLNSAQPTFRLSGKDKGKSKALLKEIKSTKPTVLKSLVPKEAY